MMQAVKPLLEPLAATVAVFGSLAIGAIRISRYDEPLDSPLWLRNVFFLLALMGLMLVEMFTCWWTRRYEPPESPIRFRLDRAVTSKITLLALVVAGALLDWVLVNLAPVGFVTEDVLSANWVTRGVLLWLITGQVLQLLTNVEAAEGDKAIPPIFRHVVRQIRRYDAKRFEHHASSSNKEYERWYDALEDLTDEEIEVLIKRRQLRRLREQGDDDQPPEGSSG
jgi:hypothetical protein